MARRNSAATPGGNNTQLQFNQDGAFGGSSDLVWDDSTKQLKVGGEVNADIASDGVIRSSDYGGVNVANEKIIKISKAHDDNLFDDPGAQKVVNLWTQPANSKLIAVKMRLAVQFDGVSLDDLDVVMGHSGGAANGLLDPASMNLTSQAVGTEYVDVGSFYDTFYEGIHGRTTAAIVWRAKATSGGANLDATTVGQLDFYIVYEQS